MWEAGRIRPEGRQRNTETRRWLKSWKQSWNITRICDLWPCCCFLLLFYPHRFQFHWTRDESDVCPFLHQSTNPPVIVVFLHDSKTHLQWRKRLLLNVLMKNVCVALYNCGGRVVAALEATVGVNRVEGQNVDHLPVGKPITSFMCRKSLVSKLIAAPWTGQSSSRAPQ